MDSCGFPLALRVTPADVQDRDGARMLLAVLMLAFGWIKIIRADSAYGGPLEDEVRSIPRHRKVKLEIVKRSDDVKGFKVLPKRWIACGCLRCAPAVERTFGWLRWRRLGDILLGFKIAKIYG